MTRFSLELVCAWIYRAKRAIAEYGKPAAIHILAAYPDDGRRSSGKPQPVIAEFPKEFGAFRVGHIKGIVGRVAYSADRSLDTVSGCLYPLRFRLAADFRPVSNHHV